MRRKSWISGARVVLLLLLMLLVVVTQLFGVRRDKKAPRGGIIPRLYHRCDV